MFQYRYDYITVCTNPCYEHANISLPIFKYTMIIFDLGGRCCHRDTREIEVSENFHQISSYNFITQDTPPPSYGTATANDTSLQEPK